MTRSKVEYESSFISLPTLLQKGKARKQNRDDERRDLLEKIDMVNDRFFAYYKAQGILPVEEWDHFVQGLQQPLPTTFRLAGSRQCVQCPRTFSLL
jgi:multisite-specific tRNA:(cytosine-C5)-methyltransferase